MAHPDDDTAAGPPDATEGTEHSPGSGSGSGEGAPSSQASGRETALRERLSDLEGRLQHAEDQMRRAVADTDNLRKRHARERERERLADRMRAAETWLPVLDNLELALGHAQGADDVFVEGVRAVYQQGLEAMSRLGFPRFEAEGAAFDPTLHEAVSSYPDPAQAGRVLAVTRPGYGTAEALLRPAQVVVAVAP